MFESKPLQGLTALVTGASSGIGAATVIALAGAGANVIVHYNSKAEEAEKVAKQARALGVSADIVAADLSSAAGTRELGNYAAGHQINILVNNAGSLLARTKVLDFSEDLWEKVMMLNLTSAFFLSKAVLPGMLKSGRGYIVNISSVAARFGGGVGALAYSSAKAAVSAMTKGLTKEFATAGIRVNAVSPGTVETNYHRTFSTAEALEATRAATPAGKLGTPEEIAGVVVFLCTKEAEFIHGQVIEVNGGFFMG